MTKRTVLSHFYNEEYLLPWWLKHHRKIFDHGIMVDYDSTDRSRDIIRELCPTWEIVTSRHRQFECMLIDQEIADLEANLSGWRMCLNTTEFLQHLHGQVFLTNYQAIQALTPEIIHKA